jgi:hypothetical protein
MPQRVQRKRSKGWRMPPGAIYVGRPSKWGNPFVVGLISCGCRSVGECTHNIMRVGDRAEAVDAFRGIKRSAQRIAEIKRELRGRDLACWCSLKTLCHADVLLEIANS